MGGIDNIDVPIFSYFNSPPAGMHLRIEGLTTAKRRRLSENACGPMLMFDEEHWTNKRGHVPRAPDATHMNKAFDPTRFNFNKVDTREQICQVTLCGDQHPVLVNVSPLMVGHTVIPLWAERGLPQGALGKRGVQCMFELAATSARADFRVGYNSLGAYASVNHLHVHGMYAAALDGQVTTDSFPIEAVARVRRTNVSGAAVSILTTNVARTAHFTNGLVFEGAFQAVAEAAGACVELLAAMNIPHNVLVRMKPNPACFVVPRKPQECFDVAGVGCNAAICEVSGFLVMQSSKAYEELTLDVARAAFLVGASLPKDDFDAFLERLDSIEVARSPSSARVIVWAIGVGAMAMAVCYVMRRRAHRIDGG